MCKLTAREIYSRKRPIELFHFDKPFLMVFEPDELEILVTEGIKKCPFCAEYGKINTKKKYICREI